MRVSLSCALFLLSLQHVRRQVVADDRQEVLGSVSHCSCPEPERNTKAPKLSRKTMEDLVIALKVDFC